MKLVLLLPLLPTLLLACADGEMQYIPVPFTKSAPTGPSFVQANNGATDSNVTSVSTSAQTTNASDAMFVVAGMANSGCSGINVGTGSGNNTWGISDTGGDTFVNIIPSTGGYILRIDITNAGAGYASTPTMTISGCSSGGTYSAIMSGTTPNLTVTGWSASATASGCGPTNPTVAFSGGGSPSVTAQAVVKAVGISAGLACMTAYYSSSLAGTSSNVVTFAQPDYSYSGLSIIEFSNASTLDAEADGIDTSGTSHNVTTGTYSTTVNSEIEFLGSIVKAIGCSFTAASGWTSPAAASPPSGNGVICINTQYKTLSSTVSGVTATSATASGAAGDVTGILGTFH